MILFDDCFDTLLAFDQYGMKVASQFSFGDVDSGHSFQYCDFQIALHGVWVFRQIWRKSFL